MSPDRRTLFEAALGALLIRTVHSRAARPPLAEPAEQNPKRLPSDNLSSGEPARRAR
jgi:hypothetical protein